MSSCHNHSQQQDEDLKKEMIYEGLFRTAKDRERRQTQYIIIVKAARARAPPNHFNVGERPLVLMMMMLMMVMSFYFSPSSPRFAANARQRNVASTYGVKTRRPDLRFSLRQDRCRESSSSL